ncbi:RND family efflux transporter MFP subunit [Bosea sp. OAE752]|jgi:RND family efflux transporter MFP subunit|uniref:efflux RND transporter periplasmic adaptor subunit n=2 Tax=unclassified Bosea (in: a-proteobacteria) TaxID=2653178 RepID=UPI00116A5CF4
MVLAACGEEKNPSARAPMSVKAERVSASQHALSVALTGEVKARVQSDLAFRFTGRIAERFVEIGDHVEAGQVLARLESQEQTADLASMTAGVQSAEATLRQTTAAFERQKSLLANGFTTQTNYDNAQQAMQAARATLDAARSNLGTAREQLVYTSLTADASGVVVARNAEAGQVVEAAQAVFTIARDGERDAVFDVYEGLLAQRPADDTIELALVSNPAVRATGKVREVAPAIDPATGTVRVKISIDAPPPAMTLGAAVTGIGRFKPDNVFALPASAFFTENGKPAVWTVDPRSHAAAIRPITVDSYRTGELLVRDGLEAGDIVVTAGTQLLRPGQIVKPLLPDAQPREETKK